MELNLTKMPGEETAAEAVQLADNVFNYAYKPALIHQVVVAYLARGRAGTKAQKTRAEVSGGGAKPWRQKGTGRARFGSSRNPIWRGGGVTFAAKPRNHAKKVNKKMFKNAMRSIFAELLRQERLILVENFVVASNKTKELAAKLKIMQLDNVLIVADQIDMNLYLASRNLPKVEIRDVQGINPINLIGFDKILLTVPALKQIEGVLE